MLSPLSFRSLFSSRSRPLWIAVACAGALGAATPASATVDAFYDQVIIVAHPQTGDLCYREVPMLGSFGVPPALMMMGAYRPYNIPYLPSGDVVDINELSANSTPLVATYVSDSYNETTKIQSYSMRLDVSQLAAAKGTSKAGRQSVIETTKLGLLAMAENMHRFSNGRYHLRVEIIGLPVQTDLPGAKVYAKTNYPYSAGSPLLAAYEAELIDVEGTCDGGA